MKKTVLGITGAIESLIGLILFAMAQMEISTNSKYTWTKPFTEYEFQFLMMRVIGIAVLISGISSLLVWLYFCLYSERHVQDVNEVTAMGGTVKCAGCGLMVTANVSSCPRCGQTILKSTKNEPVISSFVNQQTDEDMMRGSQVENTGKNFCSNCGSKLKEGAKFCSCCGQPLD